MEDKLKAYYIDVTDLIGNLAKEFYIYCTPDEDPIRKVRLLLADYCIRDAATFRVAPIKDIDKREIGKITCVKDGERID